MTAVFGKELLNGDCQEKGKLAAQCSCECRCLVVMGISMSTPRDAYCGMPSCMRLALARESLPSIFSILSMDDGALCIHQPVKSTGFLSMLLCGRYFAPFPRHCHKKLTACLSHASGQRSGGCSLGVSCSRRAPLPEHQYA